MTNIFYSYHRFFKKRNTILMLLLLAFIVGVKAQNHNIKFKHITSKDGLVHNHVVSILQDSKGFMWFATRAGLNRYDGYDFELFKHNSDDQTSMSSNNVSSMYEDSEGYIWIGYVGGGLDRYDHEKNTFENFNSVPKSTESIPTSNVSAIKEDKQGNLWVGIYNGGLIKFNPDRTRFTRIRYDSDDPDGLGYHSVRILLEDSEGNIWIGFWSDKGLDKYDPETETFEHFTHNPDDHNTLSDNSVYDLHEDKTGRIWIATLGGGVSCYDPEKGQFTNYVHDPRNSNSISSNVVRAIEEDENGNMWFGTENGGISVLNPDKEKFTILLYDDIDSESISNNSVYSLYKDPQGNIWAGTYSGGVNVYFKSYHTFEHFRKRNIENSLTHNSVTCFEQDHLGNIWVGTDGGGINILNEDNNSFRSFRYERDNENTLGSDFLMGIDQDSRNNVWIATWGGGLNLYDYESKSFKRFQSDPDDPTSINSNSVSKAYEDHEGKLWVGTFGGGLNLYDYNTETFSHLKFDHQDDQSISNNHIVTIIEDKFNSLWVGTDGGGLNLYHRKSGHFRRFLGISDDRSGLRNGNIQTAFKDNNDELWFGTNKGLHKLNAENLSFDYYSFEELLSIERILGIEQDDEDNLWLSTNDGVIVFHPEKGVQKKYSGAHGLQDVEFNRGASFRDKDGFIYFGGINGFNRFHPDDIETNVEQPPVVIVDLQIFNQSVKIGDRDSLLKKSITETERIEIPWRYSVFSLQYAALNYSFSPEIEYAYMLENFDEDWYYVGNNRKVTYTNLDAGEYVFKIKCKVDGKWSEGKRKLKIVVLPPYWQTLWFRGLLGLVVILILVGLLWYRMRRIRKLNRLVNERTEEIRQQNSTLEQQKEQLTGINSKLKDRQDKIESQAKELIRQRNQLEYANATKDKFLSIIAHDLRSPFNTILGFSDLLLLNLENCSIEDLKQQISQIRRAGEQTYTLLEDLLLWANSQAGELNVNLENVKVSDVYSEIIELLKNQADSKNIAIHYSEPEPAAVSVDRYMFKTIIRNLLSNAIKFTGEGGRIAISVIKESGMALITVSDSGVGIDKEYQEKLWDVAAQTTKAGTANERGSGLGLLLCKEFVERHGGQIWVESEPGKGSDFKFTVPLA